jgi:hypothetical protein
MILCGGLRAQDAAQEGDMATRLAPSAIVEEFAEFAGSADNAIALVEGLRSGGEIILTGRDESVVRFAPATGPLGYGNVSLALSLAQTNLTLHGLFDPDAQEIAAAMAGGDVVVAGESVTLPGVLNLRARGMLWSEVAQALGFPLGEAVSLSSAEDAAARMAIASRWQRRDVEILDHSIGTQHRPRPQRVDRPERLYR